MARYTLRPMSDAERLKYEAAEQLGLIDRLLQVGWAGLTAGETGKIGGLVSRQLRENRSKTLSTSARD